MKKLLELEAKLIKAKEELEKNAQMGYGGDEAGGTPAPDVNMAKESLLGSMNPMAKDEDEEEEKDDKKKDKKMIEAKLDEHNEKKHGEPKDENSAMKSDIPKDITDQDTSDIVADQEKPRPMEKGCETLVKFHPNGQWSLEKADVMDPRANGKFDVPVEEVYNGDDEFTHIGNRGVDGDDKGKTQKMSDKEKKLLKD